MSGIEFKRNDAPTVGVEVELQLVDAASLELKSASLDILADVPEEMKLFFKPELVQCCLEINTDVCKGISDVEADLAGKLKLANTIAANHGTAVHWGGTHPFSEWYKQEITPDPRYLNLVELLQDTARRLITFGLHVHVGVDTGDKAVMICERLMNHLPLLLALSANSPMWGGRPTGLRSQRSKIMDNLPTAGLPPMMRNWSEYVWLVNHLIDTGFINTIREIWWDVRPHNNFGTVEVRICDVPASLDDVLGLAALVQCLVHALSEEIDAGTYQHDCHPMMVRQNKWRAARHGIEAELVDPLSQERLPARKVAVQLVERLKESAQTLGCEEYLKHVADMASNGTGADRQISVFQQNRDAVEIVRSGIELSNASLTRI